MINNLVYPCIRFDANIGLDLDTCQRFLSVPNSRYSPRHPFLSSQTSNPRRPYCLQWNPEDQSDLDLETPEERWRISSHRLCHRAPWWLQDDLVSSYHSEAKHDQLLRPEPQGGTGICVPSLCWEPHGQIWSSGIRQSHSEESIQYVLSLYLLFLSTLI